MRIARPPRSARWLAAAVGVGVAVAAMAAAPPAGASTVVSAQLSLSGIVTDKSPLGGSVVGIHPGDSLDLKAAPAGVSVQELNSLGIPLGDVLGNLLGQVVGYQVVLHLPATFPGGKRDVKLGACGGKAELPVAFPKAGSYGFTWSAYAVTVLPVLGTCRLNTINLDGNQLAQVGITLNASNEYLGKVVVANDPPPGGLSVQLPSVGLHPSLPGVGQLPSASLPGTTLPTLPVSPPSVTAPLPSSSASSTPVPAPSGSSGSGSSLDYTPPGESIQDKVMPKGYGCCDEGGHSPDSVLNSVLLSGLGGGTGAVPNAAIDARGLGGGDGEGVRPAPTTGSQPIDLAANKAPAGQLPVLLSILAIIALSLVTATYARLYLLRREVS